MAKLTEAERKQIRVEFAAGASKVELAKKFGVSDVAIAKLLKKGNGLKSNQDKPTGKPPPKSNRESAKDIVANAYAALLEKDCSKIAPETLLKIIERMTAIYGPDELEKVEVEKVEGLVIEIEDASVDEDTD